jgi:DNA polymerase-3 subunit delta'
VHFAEALGHEALLEGLWRAARAERLAHALCFSGPLGVGKFLAAERLAFGLLCERGPVRGDGALPCGSCGPCKRAKSDAHPDLLVIDPTLEEEETIKIARIAGRGEDGSLEEFLALRPMEGGWRIVLVREAERLVEEAQNALLKTLEEPGDATLLVLETSRGERLLPTIHSRCVRVAFEALEPRVVEALLEREGVARADAVQLARWSRGAPGVALTFAKQGALAMRGLFAAALAGEIESLALLQGLAELELEFPGKTPLARERSKVRATLDLWIAVLGDLLRARGGVPAQALAHGDLVLRAERCPGPMLAEQLEQALAARQDVDHNLAPDAALERALLAWKAGPRAAPLHR